MTAKGTLTPREAKEREKARLLEQAATLDREIAEIAQLERQAAKHGLVLTVATSIQAPRQFDQATVEASPKSQRSQRVFLKNTIAALVASYRTDERSPYRDLRYRTRGNYDGLLRIIQADLGDKIVGEIEAKDLLLTHQIWTARGLTMANALIGMLRTLANFGGTILKDTGADRLSLVLHRMRFKTTKTQPGGTLTVDQVKSIISNAHAAGLHSIALAQAFQFGCMLRQRDVIGEWVPKDEPGEPIVINGKQKWLRGLLWSEIDHLVLRHVTSKSGKLVEYQLSESPILMEELERQFGKKLPPTGPVIVSETSRFPYVAWEFRRLWRQLARAAGVPEEVKNMDSATNTYSSISRVNGHAVPDSQIAEMPTD